MTQLRQSLTLFDMTMIAIGATIGSGIFLTPSIAAQALPSPALMLAVWFVGMTSVQKPAQAWAGLLFLGLGVPVSLFWRRRSSR